MTDLVVDDRLAANRTGATQLQRQWQPASGDPSAAVLLVHGIGEHSGRYDHVGRALALAGMDVLGFDNRGHGQSGGRRGHVEAFSEFLDDVEDLIAERRELGVPVVLIGHSLGGLIAAHYMTERRPSPDLLVLSAPALRAEVPVWQRLLAPILVRLVPRLFVPSNIDPTILSRDEAVQQAYADDPVRVGGGTVRLGHESFGAMERTVAGLSRITVPTYVLHGTDDELVPPAASEPLSALANVTYRLWPGLRHESFNEPEQNEVLAEMIAWIGDQLAVLADRS
ncbi:MAG: lysophospholipase [Actinomycetota bacterium]